MYLLHRSPVLSRCILHELDDTKIGVVFKSVLYGIHAVEILDVGQLRYFVQEQRNDGEYAVSWRYEGIAWDGFKIVGVAFTYIVQWRFSIVVLNSGSFGIRLDEENNDFGL